MRRKRSRRRRPPAKDLLHSRKEKHFIAAHDEALSVAVRVNDPDSSPFAIRLETQHQLQPEFRQIGGDDLLYSMRDFWILFKKLLQLL